MDLKELREEINSIDYEIVKLLNKRLEMALRAKKFKPQVVDKEREKQVIDHVQKIPLQLVGKKFSKELFEQIISECRGIQMEDRKLVGFQGEHGANGELAVTRYAPNFVPIPCLQFSDVVEGIMKNYFDLGMLPVENSVEGGVSEVNDLLIAHELSICGEIKQPLDYALLTLPETDYRGIKVVYSHPQVLARCGGFISRNNLEARPYYNAAAAARMIAETKPRASAAIASTLCAALQNLAVIKENIEDDTANFTRFVLLSKEKSEEEGGKCSVAFTTRDRFGELYAILKIFSDAKINLIRIESRPSPVEKGRYVFLVDFNGSDRDERIKKTLEAVEKKAVMYKLLGCCNEVK
jgi:prephenate dehydratase/chorismate mutase/prephenate dehydratase